MPTWPARAIRPSVTGHPVRQPIQDRGGHHGIAEHGAPLGMSSGVSFSCRLTSDPLEFQRRASTRTPLYRNCDPHSSAPGLERLTAVEYGATKAPSSRQSSLHIESIHHRIRLAVQRFETFKSSI